MIKLKKISSTNSFFYICIFILCSIIPIIMLDITNIDWSVPLVLKGDSIGWATTVKSFLDGGNIYSVPNFGAPFAPTVMGQINFNLPILLFIKIGTLITNQIGFIMNGIFLLSFPLTGITTAYALKKMNIGKLAAAVGAVAYACLFYHFYRSVAHLDLSWFMLVPLACLICYRILNGNYPIQQNEVKKLTKQSFLNRDFIFAAFVFLLLGISDLYYALFSGILLFFCIVIQAVKDKQVKHPLVNLLFIMLPCIIGLSVCVAYWKISMGGGAQIASIDSRSFYDLEVYGFKLSQLLLPNQEHRIVLFRNLTQYYQANTQFSQTETVGESLGFFGSIGLLISILAVFIRKHSEKKRLTLLGTMNIILILFAMVGGFNIFIGLFITDVIRCYNRLSIYIAFFSIAASCILLGWAFAKLKIHKKNAIAIFMAGVLCFAVALDQSPMPDKEYHLKISQEAQNVQDYSNKINNALPDGGMIFYYPAVGSDFFTTNFQYDGYEMYLPYLYTSKNIQWSVGQTVENSKWYERLGQMQADDLLKSISLLGFSAISIDTKWVDSTTLVSTEYEFNTMLEEGPLLKSSDGRYLLYDIRKYAERYRNTVSDKEKEKVMNYMNYFIEFDRNFYGNEDTTGRKIIRWMKEDGTMTINNLQKENVKVKVQMILSEVGDGNNYPVTFTLRDKTDTITVNNNKKEIDLEYELLPGENNIKIHSFAPDARSEEDKEVDPRDLHLYCIFNDNSGIEVVR